MGSHLGCAVRHRVCLAGRGTCACILSLCLGLASRVQLIGRAFGEADLLQLAHTLEQTAGVMAGARPAVYAAHDS